MVSQEACHRGSLIVRHLEEVAEAASAEYHLLAGAFWVVDCGTRVYLGSTDRRDERAGDREIGIELSAPTARGLA